MRAIALLSCVCEIHDLSKPPFRQTAHASTPHSERAERTHLHGADEHARQPERHGLRKLVAPHRHLRMHECEHRNDETLESLSGPQRTNQGFPIPNVDAVAHLEAVAKIDVQDLPREAVQHQVRRMPISEPVTAPHTNLSCMIVVSPGPAPATMAASVAYSNATPPA
eukprot:144177-Pleurochrysis_carterae.AAC.2